MGKDDELFSLSLDFNGHHFEIKPFALVKYAAFRTDDAGAFVKVHSYLTRASPSGLPPGLLTVF